MIPLRIEGNNLELTSEDPAVRALQVVYYPSTNTFVSSWEPTPRELERLNAGGRVLLYVMGKEHPPVLIDVE